MIEHLIEAIKATQNAGPWLYFVFFVFGNALLLPASVLSIGAGYVCGFGPGWFVVALARPCAAALTFSIARRWLGGWARARASRVAWLDAIDRAFQRAGMRVVVLIRLSPIISSTISNYLFGLTRMDFRLYVLGSALGVLPSTTLYTYAGAGLRAVGELSKIKHSATPAEQALFWLGLFATALAAWLVQRLARRELQEILANQGKPAA
jgi:uncharacterized membrane protein YdjX (TVP38/TMEM64 family)